MNSLLSDWLFFLGILFTIFIVVWALLSKRPDQNEVTTQNKNLSKEEQIYHSELGVGNRKLFTNGEDNLEIIEGIGLKIAQLLKDQGINTFNELAEMKEDELRNILSNAKMRLSNPGTWSKQAKYAASGDVKGLVEYQERLKGGIEH